MQVLKNRLAEEIHLQGVEISHEKACPGSLTQWKPPLSAVEVPGVCVCVVPVCVPFQQCFHLTCANLSNV